MRPFVDDALDVFGPARLMVGQRLAGIGARGRLRPGVATRIALIFDDLDPAERDAVLGGTAIDFYGLDPGLLDRAGKETP